MFCLKIDSINPRGVSACVEDLAEPTVYHILSSDLSNAEFQFDLIKLQDLISDNGTDEIN